MLFVRLTLVFAAVAVAAAVSEAQPRPTPTTPLAVVVLASIDDPVVVADLKLKDEQVKALVARRKELWDETYTTAPNKLAETAGARTEATDALLKKTLTADQYKRAVQLGAQDVLRAPFFGKVDADTPPTFRLANASAFTLRIYPELAATFKLTDEQKKQLELPAAKGLTDERMLNSSRACRWCASESNAASASTRSQMINRDARSRTGVNCGESLAGPSVTTAPAMKWEWVSKAAVSLGQLLAVCSPSERATK